MNLEGLTLKILTDFLQQQLLGSKIYKVFMPNPHSLLLMLRRREDHTALLADLSSGSLVLCIPDRLPENPETPPTFCMLLRKHLEEGRITAITQNGLDRVITLEIDIIGPASKIITKQLIFELTGKNSNIIFLQDNIILDSLKHINATQSSYRKILPGKKYMPPPPKEGLSILDTDPTQIVTTANSLPAATFVKSLISTTTGIGKATAMELLISANILPEEIRLTWTDIKALAAQIQNLQIKLKAAGPHEVYVLISRTNQVKTILTLPPKNLEPGMQAKKFNDINSAINFALNLKPIQLPQHEQLQKLVSTETTKLEKKLQALHNDLDKASNAEEQRIIADTLMANIYKISKGQNFVELQSIYDGTPLKVQLSPMLTPTENAQSYYKRYNKYKRAQNEVTQQIKVVEENLHYLSSLDASLLTATSKNELEEIRQEMLTAGFIKEQGHKKRFPTLSKSIPLCIHLNEDTDIYIGKNNRQNDFVTFTIGRSKDLWLHVKNMPGSHVIIKTSLPQPRKEEIILAAQFAAYFSKARFSTNVPVDCTERRHVKKPSGSKPGFVIFTKQITYYVTPEKELIGKYLS